MKRLPVFLLVACIGLAWLALPAAAQTIQPIYSFNFAANPETALTLGPDGDFYGTTYDGGSAGFGTVFQITTNGNLTLLASFATTNGAYPHGVLVFGPDGNLYGTTVQGGSGVTIAGGGVGTVFRITTNGALTTLASFDYTNGQYPNAGLTLGPDGNFYGTTEDGGSNGVGTVFRITTDGTITTLASLGYTNGAYPVAGLTLGPDGDFYGTTRFTTNGDGGYGTVFRITANGTLNTLAVFGNTNGAQPCGGLTLGPEGSFYGTTLTGGGANRGTVFQITTNGILTTLASFTGTNGANPEASLTVGPDGNFYGTTLFGGSGGGISGDGTVFRITTGGTLTAVASFNGNDGYETDAALTLGPDGNFYGTSYAGGIGGGVIYRLNLPFSIFVSPTITNQPVNKTVPIGGTANFAVGATGNPPLSYHWYFNTNTPLTGATNANLSFGPVLTNQAGQYQVIVSNPDGSATSSAAELTVLLQPNCYGISNNGSGTVTLLLASTPGSTNRLWATTNLELPLAQWQPITTNTADPTGFFQFIDTNNGEGPAKFYILSSP